MKKTLISIIFIPIIVLGILLLICNYYIIQYKVMYNIENFSIRTLSFNFKNVSITYNGTKLTSKKVFIKIISLSQLHILSKFENLSINNKTIEIYSSKNSLEYIRNQDTIKISSNSLYIKNYKLDINKLYINVKDNIINGKFLIPNKVYMPKNSIIKSLVNIKFNDYIFFYIHKKNTPLIEVKTNNIKTNFFKIESLQSSLKILSKNKNIIDFVCSLNNQSNIHVHGLISSFTPINAELNCTLKNVSIIDYYLNKLSTKNKLVDFIFDIVGISPNSSVKNYDIKIKNGNIEINE